MRKKNCSNKWTRRVSVKIQLKWANDKSGTMAAKKSRTECCGDREISKSRLVPKLAHISLAPSHHSVLKSNNLNISLSSQPYLGFFLQSVETLILNIFSHSITLSFRSSCHRICHHNSPTRHTSFTHLSLHQAAIWVRHLSPSTLDLCRESMMKDGSLPSGWS